MKKFGLALGLALLVIAAVPVCEYLFFNQGLRTEQMKGEEILLGQIWSAVSPTCAIIGISMIYWASRK